MSDPQPTNQSTTADQNEQKPHKEPEKEQQNHIEKDTKNQNEVSEVNNPQQKGQKETPLHKEPSGTKHADTKIAMSGAEMITARSMKTPRITISEVMNSPSEVEPLSQPQGQRGRCPIYYGIKSYIHDFYQQPDKEVLKSGEYLQEDDFQFLVEPGKRRWRGRWLRVTMWFGVNLMLIGIIAMLVGHLTTPRQTVVHQQDNFTVLDRWAVTFNNRLVICQLAGLATFTSGAVVLMLALLVSSYQQDHSTGYYIMSATLVPQPFTGNPLAVHRIPLSSSVRGIQPTFLFTR